MTHRSITLLLSLLTAAAPLAASAAERVAPESKDPWRVAKHSFDNKKANENFSGFACAPKAPDFCLLAADEGKESAFMRLGKERLDYVGKPFRFPDVEKEFDAEGVATDDDYFYVAGSHAVKRKSCEENPDNRRVYRIVNHAGGKPDAIEYTDRLWDVMRDLPELAKYVDPKACLGEKLPEGKNGVDIEGIAAANGRLFFGLRGPSLDGQAFIVGVDAKALFSGADAKPALTKVKVGDKRGFRDLATAQGEILALVGPDDDNLRRDYSVFELRGLARGGAPVVRELAVLNLDDARSNKTDEPIKPEALTLLAADPTHYRLLVLSDGGKNGAPLVFYVPR